MTTLSRTWRVLAALGLMAALTLPGPAAAQLDAFHAQFWSQGSFAFAVPEDGDVFGQALAAGDFNGDGRADLAIGSPGEAVATGIGVEVVGAGTVIVLYGTSEGLSSTGSQLFRQGGGGLAGTAEVGDRWGRALATGDFDGDGFDDLAVGAPNHTEGGQALSGEIQVLYGSAAGLMTAGSDSWTSFQPFADQSKASFQIGSALAGGDFDDDGYDDLAVGVPGGLDGSLHTTPTGGVLIYRGSASGLVPPANDADYWDPMSDLALEGDGRFGFALAAGDLDGDRHDDLVVGAPDTRWGLPERSDAGAVHVIHGSATGLTAAGDRLAYGPNAGDFFGRAVAIGDVDWAPLTNPREVLVGAPGVDVGAVVDAGAIRVLALDDTNFNWDASLWFDQDTVGIEDSAEEDDSFGRSLAVGRFDADGIDDVAIGVPFEDYLEADAGLVEVLHGSSSGLSTVADHYWTQASAGVPDDQEFDDGFGDALAAGDFDGDGRSDLAVGIPAEPLGGYLQGGVIVLYAKRPGLIFADDFERGDELNWG
jgi:hypothetical protein